MNAVPHIKSFSGLVHIVDEKGRAEHAPVVDHRADELFPAASINKLAIAWALVHLLKDIPDDELSGISLSWEPLERPQGGGIFDQVGAPSEAPIPKLIHDMLANSSNTAAIVLVKWVGASEINKQLAALELRNTRLNELTNDAFEFGITTPREASTILGSLVDIRMAGSALVLSTSRRALIESSTRYGVRSTVLNTGESLANKTGQINQEDNAAEALRHDVGIFYGANGRKVIYSFFSRANSDISAHEANLAIGDLGRLLAKEAGLEEESIAIGTRRDLARTALKGMTIQAKGRVTEKVNSLRQPRLK